MGDKIKVFINSIDQESSKVSLGFKRKEDNPWVKAQETFNVEDVVTVKIVRLVAFGAFAELLPTVDGLIHISQISTEHIAKPSSVLSIGQEVEAKITNIDWENRKISLSIRALLESEGSSEDETPQEEAVVSTEEQDIETVDNGSEDIQSDDYQEDTQQTEEEAPVVEVENDSEVEIAPAAHESAAEQSEDVQGN